MTESGALFLEDAKSILETMERAKQKIAMAQQQPAVLRICHLPAATHLFLPDIIHAFHTEYPSVRIRLIRQDAYQLSESVACHDADIYFSMLNDLSKHPSLATEKVQSDSFCLVTRKDHPALQQSPLDFARLAQEPFLVFYPKHARFLNQRMWELCDELYFHPKITETFELYENLLQAVESGTGISILPYRSRSYMQANHLAFTPLPISQNDLDLAIAWEQEITNPAVPLFLKLFHDFMQEHPEMF